MGNTSQKARHISGDDTGPSLTAGRFVDGNFDADPYTGYGQGVAYQKRARAATASQTEVEEPKQRLLPTVFKWEGGGKEVFLTGSFNNWKTKIPLVKSHGDFYTIVDLPEGDHQYKFYVDGQWVHDTSEPTESNNLGTFNNVVHVRKSDFEVFDALDLDSRNTSTHKKSDMLPDHNMLGVCPNPWYQMLSDPGPYPHQLGHSLDQCLQLPEMGDVCSSPSDEYGQDIPVRRAGEKQSGPPILPPHLLQVLLNKDTPAHCEPTLLPEPNHVMLNHLYALSIKDGVMVLSATHRFRKKYVTTLLYKPI